jgi:hypothetical protein
MGMMPKLRCNRHSGWGEWLLDKHADESFKHQGDFVGVFDCPSSIFTTCSDSKQNVVPGNSSAFD